MEEAQFDEVCAKIQARKTLHGFCWDGLNRATSATNNKADVFIACGAFSVALVPVASPDGPRGGAARRALQPPRPRDGRRRALRAARTGSDDEAGGEPDQPGRLQAGPSHLLQKQDQRQRDQRQTEREKGEHHAGEIEAEQ